MLKELSQPFEHQDDFGGNRVPGERIRKKGFKGIHFHSEPIKIDNATTLLRAKGLLGPNEEVVALQNCGRDRRGKEGHAAQTNLDRELENDPVDIEAIPLFDSLLRRIG